MAKRRRLIYYGAYTVSFMLLAGLVLFFYYSQGKTMIEAEGDGFRQHFRALLYYSEYLKNVISTFMKTGKLVIPQWDFVIGEGSDILKSLHYYCVGDIFTFFCFLCPKEKMYIYFDFATVCRMFCSGIAFSELCFYKRKTNIWAVLAGAVIYAFCPFSLANMGAHVFFLSAAFFLPLIILGVEKIINDDSPYLLSVAVCLSSMSNIYFFYMNVVSTVIFVLVRVLLLDEELKKRAVIVLRITLYSFIGVLLSAVVFLPMFFSMLSNTRMDSVTSTDLFYSPSYYVDTYTRLSFNGYFYYGGFTILGIVSLIYLFFHKRNRTLQTLFLVSVIFILFPFFGKLYNAMVYPTYRWIYAVSLLVAYIIVDCFDDNEQILNYSILEMIITILYYASCIFIDSDNIKIHIMFLILLLLFFAVSRYFRKKMIINLLIFGISMFCVFFDIMYNFSPMFWYYAQSGLKISEIAEIKNEEHSVFAYIDDDSFYRYSGNSLKSNESIQGNKSSTQYYWSVVNDYVVDFRKDLGISDNSNHHQNNYDDRFALNALSGVKYYIKNDQLTPYGFSYFDHINGYDVYRSDFNLPLIYSYDSYITRDEWNKLDLVEKNETLLQTAVVDGDINLDKKTKIIFDNKSIDYTVSSHDNIELTNDQIKINKAFSDIVINCKSDQTGEYYFVIDGLNSDESAYIGVGYNDVFKNLKFKGNKSLHYSDRHDYIINLGYMEGIDGDITITFPIEGLFSYSNIRIICQPLDKQIDLAKKLNNTAINKLVIDANTVESEIETDHDALVCLSIPYSEGWKVFVDGQEEQLLNCNIQYMGLLVKQGKHQIELKYSTPHLKQGMIVSAFGFGVLLVTDYVRKRRQKNKQIAC